MQPSFLPHQSYTALPFLTTSLPLNPHLVEQLKGVVNAVRVCTAASRQRRLHHLGIEAQDVEGLVTHNRDVLAGLQVPGSGAAQAAGLLLKECTGGLRGRLPLIGTDCGLGGMRQHGTIWKGRRGKARRGGVR